MPPRRRSTPAALWVAAAVCVLASLSFCACAPTGDVMADVTTTEENGQYRPPPPGEDGAYHPEPEGEQTLEGKVQQSDDGAYVPERYETPSPEGAHSQDNYWTEGALAGDSGNATGSEDASEASDDGSYRAEHQQAEDYDERADNGQNSVTSSVEPTEAADDGSYRPGEFTETPTEDYDEKADNGSDWRANIVEHHDEGIEAADDGSYRPRDHGPLSLRGTSMDTEKVQLFPVVFPVGSRSSSDVSPKASVRDDETHACPQAEGRPVPAAVA